MAPWVGFASMSYGPAGDDLRVSADYAGSDEDPTPLVNISQMTLYRTDIVELTEAQLRWLVDEVAPKVLKRMSERP